MMKYIRTHTQIFTRNKRYYYSERTMCLDIYNTFQDYKNEIHEINVYA